jgi:hypothetical protein
MATKKANIVIAISEDSIPKIPNKKINIANKSCEKIIHDLRCPIFLVKNGIGNESMKGAIKNFKEYGKVAKDKKPMVFIVNPASTNRAFNVEEIRAKGSPELIPRANIIKKFLIYLFINLTVYFKILLFDI